MRRILPRRTWALIVPISISGCAVLAQYESSPLETQALWSNATTDIRRDINAKDLPINQTWWTALGDPVIDALVPVALAESPTLATAIARIDEARALLGSNSAQRLPSINADIGIERARSQGDGSGTQISASGDAGLRLGWELDLFGRIRHSIEAANSRLDARSSDAEGARLALAAQVADSVVGLRACLVSEQVQTDDIASRERILALVRQRLSVGNVAKVDEARAISSLAGARTRAASQYEQCARESNALTALSGQESHAIKQLVADTNARPDMPDAIGAFMPKPPELVLMLPATVLKDNPKVIAAEREAAAAWAEIGVARAERFPRVDLGGLLTGNWLRSGGISTTTGTWSLATTLAAPIFDGGAGAANVDAASARYRAAEAELRQAVRLAAQDVENALVSGKSARQRLTTAHEALEAARVTFNSTQAQWEAGAVSLFELEDVRRELSNAENAAITAMRDSAQSWISLTLASGNTVVVASNSTTN